MTLWPYDEGLAGADVLSPAHQVALDHHPEDVAEAVGDLGGDVPGHGGLAGVVLAAVPVRAVDHDSRRQAGPRQHLRGLLHVLGVVVRPPVAATEDHVAGVVAARDHDGGQPLLRHREELVRMHGRPDRVDGDLDVAVGAVLEPDRHRETRGQLAVDLALGCPGADRAPRHQVGDELGRDGVEELAPGRQPHLGEVEQESPRQAQPVVDREAPVEPGVVDQPLPPDGRPRLLEVDAHDEQEVGGEPVGGGPQPLRVVARGVDVVDRAGSHDHQQPVVLVAKQPVDRLPTLGDRGRRLLGDRVLLHQDGGWDERAQPLDPEVVGRTQHHSASAFIGKHLHLQSSLVA